MPITRQELPLELPEQTHEALINYLNKVGIADLAEPLNYLLEQSDEEQVVIRDETGQLSAEWLHREGKRLLVVYSNIGRLAGLSLNVPVQTDAYELAYGNVGASLQPRQGQGYVPRHYLKLANNIKIGDPNTVVRVQQIAADELWRLAEL